MEVKTHREMLVPPTDEIASLKDLAVWHLL